MRYLALAFLAALLLAQGPKPIPECRGNECRHDDGIIYANPNNLPQPSWCQNKDGGGYKANCKCTRKCDHTEGGVACVTYCRTPRCRCDHGCSPT